MTTYIVRAHVSIAPMGIYVKEKTAVEDAKYFAKLYNTTYFVHGFAELALAHTFQHIAYSKDALKKIKKAKLILNKWVKSGVISDEDISDIMNQIDVEIPKDTPMSNYGLENLKTMVALGFVDEKKLQSFEIVLRAPLE